MIVFDLDDTLIREIDFLKSAYREIAVLTDEQNSDELYNTMLSLYLQKGNPFKYVVYHYPNVTFDGLLNMYRMHYPSDLSYRGNAELCLKYLKEKNIPLGLMSDGRSITQRNKIKAIDLYKYINYQEIIISEEFGSSKPDFKNYLYFDNSESDKYYIADNPKKDFVTANKLGWNTVCLLDDGYNIHKQSTANLSEEYYPKYVINDLLELLSILRLQ